MANTAQIMGPIFIFAFVTNHTICIEEPEPELIYARICVFSLFPAGLSVLTGSWGTNLIMIGNGQGGSYKNQGTNLWLVSVSIGRSID